MGATERRSRRPSRLLQCLLGRAARPLVAHGEPKVSDGLRALTLAAAALPNMLPACAQAFEIEQAQLNYSHYEEGGRDFARGPAIGLKRPPDLKVDTVRGGLRLKLDERLSASFDFSQDTWSGATPYITAPEGFTATITGASLFVNSANNGGIASRVNRRTLQPLNLATGRPATRVINVMTSASPETRQQGRLAVKRTWDEAALEVSGGLSDEPDFKSVSFASQLSLDFNSKLTTVTAGVGRTSSNIDARLGSTSNYIDYSLYRNASRGAHIVSEAASGVDSGGVGSDAVESLHWRGKRDDLSLNLGLTQVLDRSTVVASGLTYTRSQGFLENPHKLVTLAFADPSTPAFLNFLVTPVFSVPEKRPGSRHQLTWNTKLTHYFGDLKAALHLEYTHSRDDWQVRADTLEARWIQNWGAWTLTPRARRYNQTAAEFYQPYFLFLQRYPRDTNNNLDYSRMPIDAWSSDQRLSGFGAYSLGFVLSRPLLDNVKLEFGYEHYVRRGDLKWGSEGEGRFGDLRSDMVNLGISVALDGLPAARPGTHALHGDSGHTHGDAAGHAAHAGGDAPAGVMNAHMMTRAGAFMVGYSYVHSRQSGDMIRAARKASDAELLASCGALGCPVKPVGMSMHMHMLHLMYAPTDDINLMLMPQLMSMTMENRAMEGGFYTPLGGHAHDGMDLSSHTSGGFGDTQAAVQVRLPGAWTAHATLGVSMPTGSVTKRMENHGGDLMDYGMQTGSGTWDFMPSVTAHGGGRAWFWGGQISAVVRPDHPNKSGYVLGDVYQGTAWLGWRPGSQLSLTARVLHTVLGRVRGALEGDNAVVDAFGNTQYLRAQHSPADLASNTGGRYTDLGLGVSFAVPGREAQGDRIGLEWIEPVRDRVKGYQLERRGTLALNWAMMF